MSYCLWTFHKGSFYTSGYYTAECSKGIFDFDDSKPGACVCGKEIEVKA